MIVCSVICNNHQSQLLTLSQSIKRYMPFAKHLVCLVEKDFNNVNKVKTIDWILAKDICPYNFESSVLNYTQQEACAACKGFLLQYAMKNYPSEDSFIYLDADTCLYSPLQEVREALNKSDIVVTPQVISPIKSAIYIEQEVNLLKTGIINTGFLSMKKSANTLHLLSWWNDRLAKYCFKDIPQGLYLDQKWFDFLPVYYNNYVFLKHPGYNVGNWNLHERKLTIKNNTFYVNHQPLKMFHFSSLHELERNFVRSNNGEEGQYLLEEYLFNLEKYNYSFSKDIPWSYTLEDNRKGSRSIRPSRQKTIRKQVRNSRRKGR